MKSLPSLLFAVALIGGAMLLAHIDAVIYGPVNAALEHTSGRR